MATDQQQMTTEADFAGHEYLTAQEVIVWLRLDTDDRDPIWRLRNLIRCQGLPRVKRGKLQLFKRSAILKWLDGRR